MLIERERERVRFGTLDSYYEDESYDAVFAFNVIEHLLHPRNFFIEAKRILKPEGFLVLETPIQESLLHRLARVVYLLTGRNLNFFGMSPGGHIYKFSTNTFNVLSYKLGYRIIYQCNINSPFGEIWGKCLLTNSLSYKFFYMLSLPIVWSIASIMKQENRFFIILQKK